MYVLYRTPKVHQRKLFQCPNYEAILRNPLASQITADSLVQSPNTNYCWLLAPAIASSTYHSVYGSLSEYSREKTLPLLVRIAELWGSEYLSDLTGGQQRTLVAEGATPPDGEEEDRYREIDRLYMAFGLEKISLAGVYDDKTNSVQENCVALNKVLEKYGTLVMVRPGGNGFHVECVVGVSEFIDKKMKKNYCGLIVVNTDPAGNIEAGLFPRLFGFDGYLRPQCIEAGNTRFFAFRGKPNLGTYGEFERGLLVAQEAVAGLNAIYSNGQDEWAESPDASI